jgi:hypothetical protein
MRFPIQAAGLILTLLTGCGSSASTNATAADGAPADPEIDYSLEKTITMSPFTVPAGSEVYYCQNFANPWGQQVDIKTYALDMSAGSHHMFAFYQSDATDGDVAPCPNGGLTFGAFTFTAQQPALTETYPATVGATIPATTGFQMMAHYLNTTAQDLTAHVTLTMDVAKSGAVTQHAGVMYLNNLGVSAPPGVSNSEDSFTLPQAVNVMSSGSHMHSGGTNFWAKASSGETLFTTTQWSEPKAETYSPPMVLQSGTTITWQCTYDNTTGSLLTFGESATKNVMCISVSVFYPVSDINNPVLGSSISSVL